MAAIDRTAEGIRLRIKAVPGASRTEIAGVHDDAIRVRVAAPPRDGAANDALIRFLADRLSVPRSAVRLVSGERSRMKVIQIRGVLVDRAIHELLH